MNHYMEIEKDNVQLDLVNPIGKFNIEDQNKIRITVIEVNKHDY